MFSTVFNIFASIRQKRIYRKLFKRYGDHIKSLHWSSTEAQYERFEQFSQLITTDGSVFDIGCGRGDFLQFLSNKNHLGALSGCDSLKEFIDIAKSRNQEWCLYADNFLNLKLDHYEYVFACGVFAFSNVTEFKSILSKGYLLCDKLFAFNFYFTDNTKFLQLSHQEIVNEIKSLNCGQWHFQRGYSKNDITYILLKKKGHV